MSIEIESGPLGWFLVACMLLAVAWWLAYSFAAYTAELKAIEESIARREERLGAIRRASAKAYRVDIWSDDDNNFEA
jgi:hypothetical protein